MTMKEDSKTEDDFRRALWQAALIGLIVTAIEFVLFALILKSNQKDWTVELFLLLAAPVAALVGLVAGALFMRKQASSRSILDSANRHQPIPALGDRIVKIVFLGLAAASGHTMTAGCAASKGCGRPTP